MPYRKKNYTPAEKRAYARSLMKYSRPNRVYNRPLAPAISQVVRGRGAYKFDAPTTFGNAGQDVGKRFGMPGVGHLIGAGLGGLFRLITGKGEYKVSENTLYPGSITKAIPKFAEGDNTIRIRHKEYVGNISSSTAFTNRSYNLNPGNQQLFPWLSKIAENYEQYKLLGCLVYFRSLSADALNSTNTALGKVVMAADYNVNDADFINTEQFYSSMHSNSGPPSNDLMLAVECSRLNSPTNSLFIRTGGVSAGTDARLSDHAKIQIATDGSQAGADVGELWITYDMVLFNPVMNNRVGLNIHSAKGALTTTISVDHPFGTDSEFTHNDIDGLTLSDTTITFPPEMSAGTYFISWSVYGDSTACVLPTITVSNCTLKTVWNVDTGFSLSSNNNTVTKFIYNSMLTLTDRNATFALSSGDGTLPANATAGDLFIIQANHEDSLAK